MYFSKFNAVSYDNVFQVNLTTRTSVISSMKNDKNFYIEYDIQDGETPEILADRFYDDVELSFIILMFNDIINIYEEWPMDQNTLLAYCHEKYLDIHDIHHYESIDTGNVVSSNHPVYDRLPITNYEYEIRENDAKRKIKMVLPEHVQSIIEQHGELMV